jgi:hypothetical protein
MTCRVLSILQGRYWTKGFYWLSWSHYLENILVGTMTWLTLTATEYMCHKWPRIYSTCSRNFQSFPHSWLITELVTRVTRLELMSSPPVFSGVRVARSLVFYVMFCRSLFVLLSYFCLPLSYLSVDVQILITGIPFVSSNSSYRNVPVCAECTYIHYHMAIIIISLTRFWLSCFGHFVYMLPKIFRLVVTEGIFRSIAGALLLPLFIGYFR